MDVKEPKEKLQNYLTSTSGHRAIVHVRTYTKLVAVLLLMLSFLFASTMVSWQLFWLALAGTLISLWTVGIYLSIPCKCGSNYVLLHKSRRNLESQYYPAEETKSVLIDLTLLFGIPIITIALTWLGYTPFVFVYVVLGLYSVCTLGLAVCIVISLFLKKDKEEIQLISLKDLEAIESLPGNSYEEIEKKVKLYFELGEFEKADFYSKKQLAMVENDI